jgi:hypothetical protein
MTFFHFQEISRFARVCREWRYKKTQARQVLFRGPSITLDQFIMPYVPELQALSYRSKVCANVDEFITISHETLETLRLNACAHTTVALQAVPRLRRLHVNGEVILTSDAALQHVTHVSLNGSSRLNILSRFVKLTHVILNGVCLSRARVWMCSRLECAMITKTPGLFINARKLMCLVTDNMAWLLDSRTSLPNLSTLFLRDVQINLHLQQHVQFQQLFQKYQRLKRLCISTKEKGPRSLMLLTPASYEVLKHCENVYINNYKLMYDKSHVLHAILKRKRKRSELC